MFSHQNRTVYYTKTLVRPATDHLNIWGVAVDSSHGKEFFKQILNANSKVTLEEAIFRSEKAFRPAKLQECRQIWEEEILRTPSKTNTIELDRRC